MVLSESTKLVLLALIFCTLHQGEVKAEIYNKRNLLPGGRAAAMGGAYTAISDDASGAWYNPAGLGFTKGSDVSMSANAYTKSKRTVVGAVGNEDVSESSSSIYPAFAGGTTGFGPFRVGYAYFTSDREHSSESFTYQVEESETHSDFSYTRRLLSTGELMHAGVGIGVALSPRFSIGVSEFYYRRSRQVSLVESSVYSTGATADSNVQQNTLNEGGVTVLGTAMRFSKVAFGLSVKLPKSLADNTTIDTNQVSYTAGVPERISTTTKTHAYDEPAANEYSFGMFVTPVPGIGFSYDIQHLEGKTSKYLEAGGVTTVATTNWSLGAEFEAGSVVVRTGYFTNNAMVSKPSEGVLDQPAAINFRGWTNGISVKTKSFESTVGIVRQIGTGFDHSVSGSSSVFEVEAESTTYFLTSKYSI